MDDELLYRLFKLGYPHRDILTILNIQFGELLDILFMFINCINCLEYYCGGLDSAAALCTWDFILNTCFNTFVYLLAIILSCF